MHVWISSELVTMFYCTLGTEKNSIMLYMSAPKLPQT